ncbi:MAG: GYD domain-containing protein [Candidatus Calescibacterium sp.]|jgi:uncharacterized protein with GYD domain
MAKYVILSKITSEGLETLKENPERIKEVNEEIAEKFGVKVLSQFLVMGPYDFVNIVEAPSNEAVVKMAIELGSRGTIQTLTMPAIEIEKLIAEMKKK